MSLIDIRGQRINRTFGRFASVHLHGVPQIRDELLSLMLDTRHGEGTPTELEQREIAADIAKATAEIKRRLSENNRIGPDYLEDYGDE